MKKSKQGLGSFPVKKRHLSEGATPRLIVIDLIQTMWTDTVELRRAR